MIEQGVDRNMIVFDNEVIKTLNDISLLCCRCDSDKHLEDAKYCQHCGELLVIGAQHTFTNGVKGKAISADKKTNQNKQDH
jgi:hypothetical protein